VEGGQLLREPGDAGTSGPRRIREGDQPARPSGPAAGPAPHDGPDGRRGGHRSRPAHSAESAPCSEVGRTLCRASGSDPRSPGNTFVRGVAGRRPRSDLESTLPRRPKGSSPGASRCHVDPFPLGPPRSARRRRGAAAAEAGGSAGAGVGAAPQQPSSLTGPVSGTVAAPRRGDRQRGAPALRVHAVPPMGR